MDRRSPQLDLTLVWVGREATIRLCGELDISSLPHALKGLEEILQRQPDKLILDLAGVSFADSYGLALIVRAYKGLHGRPVIICSPSGQVRRVLQITGIDQVCAIEDPGLQWAAPAPGFPRSPNAARPG